MNLNIEDDAWSLSLWCQKSSLRSVYLSWNKSLCKLFRKIRATSQDILSLNPKFSKLPPVFCMFPASSVARRDDVTEIQTPPGHAHLIACRRLNLMHCRLSRA